MKDIVRILQDIAEARNITYHYGKKASLNLISGTLDIDKVYMLHEFTNRQSNYNTAGTKIDAVTYDGKFFLVKHSDYDMQYMNEVGAEERSKYVVNIEPLINMFEGIGNELGCTDYEVQAWSNIDVTDALDANMDGLLCTYKIKIYNV